MSIPLECGEIPFQGDLLSDEVYDVRRTNILIVSKKEESLMMHSCQLKQQHTNGVGRWSSVYSAGTLCTYKGRTKRMPVCDRCSLI